MTTRLLVLGAGGFARETLDVVEALEMARPGSFTVVGVLDDAPSPGARALLGDRGVEVVGSVESFLAGAVDIEHDAFVIAIGHPGARSRIAENAPAGAVPSVPLVHPTASLGSAVTLGAGTVVCAGAVLSTNVTVGPHGHVNPNATIGHDAQLGTAVSVNPSAVVSGAVVVGDAVLLGAASVVLQGLTIGAGAVVGAAACVTKDVAERTTVVGVPAR